MILKVIVNLLARLNDLVFARLGFYLTNRNRNFRDSVRNHVITDSINLVIDVGASHGQYGQWLRKSKFRGRLISFEPEVDSFKKLQTKSQVDGLWQSHNVALGASPSSGTLQVSGNFVSSSILEMTNLHQTAAEGSAPVGVQEVEILPLDGFIPSLSEDPSARIHMKIDVQGYEGNVLSGSRTLLLDHRLRSIEIELSTASLYVQQSNWIGILQLLQNAGFTLISISGGFYEPKSRRMLQFDALLVRLE